jgi:hypothetical protein
MVCLRTAAAASPAIVEAAPAREEHQVTMARKHPDVPFVIDFHTHMLDELDEKLRHICLLR